MNPDTLTAQALLNCLVREVSAPEGQTRESDGRVTIRLARSGRLLRAASPRRSAGIGPRLTGTAEQLIDGSWRPVGWEPLARLIADELTLAGGPPNDEFTAQVRDSHAAMTAIVTARGTAISDDPYLASEQSLVSGHRFHPAPKARDGEPRDWLRYAPETGARFPLRFLAVRDDALAGEGDTGVLDRLGPAQPPPGYRVLPAHPWQLRLLAGQSWLEAALRDRVLVDLGTSPVQVVPTSSVRTVYIPAADIFCKFSLNVRITNCVRKNSRYELSGSLLLTTLLGPVFDDLAKRFPGTTLLSEPGYRTLSGQGAESLAVIVRDGLAGRLDPGVTPLLAASLTEPRERHGPLDDRDPDWLTGWWESYVRTLAPPVLHALFCHGVVLEPHLQNVLVGLDAAGLPAQVIFRDLEGVKLLADRHGELFATLDPDVARALSYDAERGWNRVAYCLFVNHLDQVAAAIADRHPGIGDRLEAGLWARARDVLTEFARQAGWPPQLRALLAGSPLPAKANMRLRWARAADRDAAYLRVRNPIPVPGGEPAASC